MCHSIVCAFDPWHPKMEPMEPCRLHPIPAVASPVRPGIRLCFNSTNLLLDSTGHAKSRHAVARLSALFCSAYLRQYPTMCKMTVPNSQKRLGNHR